jgi:four helix bundle protein
MQPETTEYRVIKHQLIKSVTSAGANYEEAQAGSSRADFNNKIRIALREMRETNYWLRIIGDLSDNNTRDEELKQLLMESDELKSILGSIAQKTRQNK